MDKKEYAFAGTDVSTWCRLWNPGRDVTGVCSRERGHAGPHVAHHNPSGVEFARWGEERSTIASDPKPKIVHATVTVDAKDALREVEKRLAPITAILTRALAFLVDSNQYEDRAMTAARREQRRELVRDIKQAVKPGR